MKRLQPSPETPGKVNAARFDGAFERGALQNRKGLRATLGPRLVGRHTEIGGHRARCSSLAGRAVFYAHANRKKRSSVRAVLAPAPGTALWADWNCVTRESGPKQEDAWHELCRRAKRVAAVDPAHNSAAGGNDAVLNQVESEVNSYKQKSLVRLASVLIQLEGAQLSNPGKPNSAVPHQLVRLEQARRCVEALVLHQEVHGPAIPRPKPTIGEPDEPVSVTLFDLVRVMQNVLEASKAAKPNA